MKFIFEGLRKSSAVIIDKTESDTIKSCLPEDLLPAYIISLREKPVFINLKILLKMIILLPHLSILRKFSGSWLGKFYRFHLYCVLKWIDPQVVLTFIDDHYEFHELSRSGLNAIFIAFQNGTREYRQLQNFPMNYPFLFSLGSVERQLYQRMNQKVDKIIPLGSLRLAGALSKVKASARLRKHEGITVISQWINTSSPHLLGDHFAVLELINKHVARYATENHLPICVLGRYGAEVSQEAEFFQRSFAGNEWIYVHRDAVSYSSYAEILNMRVGVHFCSTLGREALALRKPVLFCYFMQDSEFGFDIPEGPLLLKSKDYDSFKIAMDFLFTINVENFCENETIKKQVDSLITLHTPQQVFEVARDEIKKLIKNKTI